MIVNKWYDPPLPPPPKPKGVEMKLNPIEAEMLIQIFDLIADREISLGHKYESWRINDLRSFARAFQNELLQKA